MNIEYKDIHDFECEDLERLFLSVEWSSGHFPDKLAIAMKNFNENLVDVSVDIGHSDKVVHLFGEIDGIRK